MMPMIRFFTQGLVQILLISLLSTSLPVWANQDAILLSNTPMLIAPSSKASIVTQLSKDAPVTLLKRKGGWYQIQTEDHQTGWLRMLKVRFLSEQESNDRSIARILRETAVMPPASGVSTGVRGVSDEALNQKMEMSPIGLEQLKHFVPVEEEVDAFAKEGKLKTQENVVLPGK